MCENPCLGLCPSNGQQTAETRFAPVMGTPNHSTPRPSFSAAVLESLSLKNLGGCFEAVAESRSASPNQSLISNRFVLKFKTFPCLTCTLDVLFWPFLFSFPTSSASWDDSVAFCSSLSGRQLCNGTTRTGKPCKKRAVPGQDYCRIHEGGYTSYCRP